MEPNVETYKFTEQMLIDLIRGKDLNIAVQNKKGEVKKFRFISPHDGVFLTHAEIEQLKYKSEMDVFRVLKKMESLEKQIQELKEQ
jgi:hypothetical protein